MKTQPDQQSHANVTVHSLLLELERCRSALADSRGRIADLERGKALVAGENTVLEMVAKGESLSSTLNGICRLVEEYSSGSLCSILLLDANCDRLRHGAAPSLPASYFGALDDSVAGPTAGPCGRACFSKKPFMVCDIASDPLGDDYQDLALAHGLHACWSTPIISSDGTVLGSLAVLWREPRGPTPQDQELISRITHLASVAIEGKRTESPLRESEERFRRMADAIPEVIWFIALDPEKVLYVSPGFERIWGLKVADLYANPRLLTELVHPGDRERVHSTFSRWVQGELVHLRDIEYRIVRPDGGIRWVHERGVLGRDQPGTSLIAGGISTDITERKQAEQRLERMETYSAVAQRLSRTGSFSWRPSDGEITWSAEVFRIYEISPDIKPTLDLARQRVHPDDLPLFEGTAQYAIQGGKDFEAEYRLLMPDGALKFIKVISRATTDTAGRLEFVGALMDITEQKRLENQLRSSERNLAEGQRLTKTGSWILDYETGNTDWSVETCRIFGFPDPPPSPHYGEFRARVRAEDRDGVDHGLRESFETGEPRPLKYVFILPNGVRKHIETISEPVRDGTGKVIKLMGTVMDVTERVKAQEDMRASEKLARGQAEALTQALDALARESSPDRIVELMLRTFTRQLDAHSSSVWLRDDTSGLMVFEFALELDDFRTRANAQLDRISSGLRIEDVWQWSEVFRTGKPHLLEDIRKGPEFPLRTSLLTQGVISVLIVPMLISGVVVGVIGIRFASQRAFRREEMELAQALTNQVTMAVQLIRHSEQSREAAVIAERNRMARDIHDALAQGFTGVIVQLEAAEDAAAKGLTAEAGKHVARAGKMARYGLSEARRSVWALRLQGLDVGDLCSALDALIQRMTPDTGLHSEFVRLGVPRPLPPEWEENLLRIAQEALTNVLRYAHATQFKVRLRFEERQLLLELRDDGCGFDPEIRRDGFGLVGMRERVEQMGGHLLIQTAVGAGTTIAITLPLKDNPKPSDS